MASRSTFTYIGDVVEANLELLHNDAADDQTVKIGCTGRVSIEEITRHVIDEPGADVEPVYESAISTDTRMSAAWVSARCYAYSPCESGDCSRSLGGDGGSRWRQWPVNGRMSVISPRRFPDSRDSTVGSCWQHRKVVQSTRLLRRGTPLWCPEISLSTRS